MAAAVVGPLLLLSAAVAMIQLDASARIQAAGLSAAALLVVFLIYHVVAAVRAERRHLAGALVQAQQQAAQARADHDRLRQAFDVLPEPVILFDAEDRVVFWNKLYAKTPASPPAMATARSSPASPSPS